MYLLKGLRLLVKTRQLLGVIALLLVSGIQPVVAWVVQDAPSVTARAARLVTGVLQWWLAPAGDERQGAVETDAER